VRRRDYANDLGEWLASRPADPQLVRASTTTTRSSATPRRAGTRRSPPVAAQVPVVETDSQTMRRRAPQRAMDWADRHGVGYLAWGWWVLPTRLPKLALIADAAGRRGRRTGRR